MQGAHSLLQSAERAVLRGCSGEGGGRPSRSDDWFGRQLCALVAESRLDALVGRVQDRWTRRLEDYAPPIALGCYQLDRVRDRGSFGVVFEGFDGELERDVAIKVFAVPNPSMHEARTLDVGREDGFTYLVFELIDGWWYDPVAPANPSPLWRCQPEDQTFSCADPLSTPKAGYPVAFATGGY